MLTSSTGLPESSITRIFTGISSLSSGSGIGLISRLHAEKTTSTVKRKRKTTLRFFHPPVDFDIFVHPLAFIHTMSHFDKIIQVIQTTLRCLLVESISIELKIASYRFKHETILSLKVCLLLRLTRLVPNRRSLHHVRLFSSHDN